MQPNPPSRYDEHAGNTVPHQPRQRQRQRNTPGIPTQPAYPVQGMPQHMPPNAPPMPPQGYAPYPPVPRKRRNPWRNYLIGCGVLVASFALATLCGGFVVVSALLNSFGEQVTGKLEAALPKQETAFQTARILDRYGNELYQLIGEGRRTKIPLSEMSKFLIDATIATEDSSFYDNPGIDVSAIARAGLGYFTGNDAGGGSTITQQLVRNIAFDAEYRAERSARRKIEEIFMAMALTQRKSKDEILEMYLNTIYYGNLAYGIEAAAQTYFGKRAIDLTLAEAALLAGLPQSPATLDPFQSSAQEAVLNRRQDVLNLMVATGKITREQANQAAGQPLIFSDPNVTLRSPHFTLYAEEQVRNLLPQLNLPETYLQFGGLTIYTTLDPTVQQLAEQSAANQIAQIKARHNANNAAVVVLKPATGEILAMVGSADYRDDSIDGRVNMATSPRQPGSAIKALTYAAAFEKGISPAAVLWDVETHIGTPTEIYSPRNYDRQYHGPVRIRAALANSYNIPAVLTLRQIGVETLLSYAARMGVQSLGLDASRFGLALTLGGGEITPLELAQSYAVFANEGKLVPARAILCITNSKGEVVYQYENGCAGRERANLTNNTLSAAATGQQVLDPRVAFLISDILADNVARSPAMGSRSPLRTDGINTSVKTGTTDDYRDNWTMGYTKNVVVGVWVGNADYTPMQNTTGLTGAAPIWNDVISGIYRTPSALEALKVNGVLRSDELTPPPGISRRQLCVLSSVIDPSQDCQRGASEWVFDSPVLVPDANGNLAPSTDPRFNPTPQPSNGPVYEMLDPAVIRTIVQPIDPGYAAQLVSNIRSVRGDVMPPPRYCLVPQEVRAQTPNAQVLAFIAPPAYEDELIYAMAYAQRANLAILPKIPCTAELIAAAPAATGVTTVISSPQPGETVTGTVYVYGTAAWPPGAAIYYKMELRGPQFPEWTTFAGPFQVPVIGGELGNFGATGLSPGVYELRIIVVGNDANYLQVGPAVPVNITGQ